MTTVYVAEALAVRYPDVAAKITVACGLADIRVAPVSGTGNIWIRDWMPVKVGDHFVKFKTKFDAVKWPHLAVSEACWTWLGDVVESDLILDGGNVARSPDGRWVLMTEQVLLDNPGHHRMETRLGELLEAEIVLLPVEPGDDLGHVDGICHWIDDRTVFLNDYSVMHDEVYDKYEAQVRKRLEAAGIEAVKFPYAYDQCPDIDEEEFRRQFPGADAWNPCVGYYTNFLKVGNLVLFPIYGLPQDQNAEASLKTAFPGITCVGIDCSHLALEGGAVHCVTWSDGN
jgi:agmatine deiminase